MAKISLIMLALKIECKCSYLPETPGFSENVWLLNEIGKGGMNL